MSGAQRECGGDRSNTLPADAARVSTQTQPCSESQVRDFTILFSYLKTVGLQNHNFDPFIFFSSLCHSGLSKFNEGWAVFVIWLPESSCMDIHTQNCVEKFVQY